jgi:ATP-binding cassette, subfamily B, bacterial PglK
MQFFKMSNFLLRRSFAKRFQLAWRCISILEKSEREKFFKMLVIQIAMGMLDLVGIAAFGLLGILAINGIQSIPPSGNLLIVLQFLHVENLSFQMQVGLIGILATFVLVSRTIFSVYFTRRILFFLSGVSSKLSEELSRKIFLQNYLWLRQKSTQEIVYALNTGITIVMLGIVGVIATLVVDLSLLIIISLSLLFVNPIVALASITFFTVIAYILFSKLGLRSQILGSKNVSLSIESSEVLMEILGNVKETIARNRQPFYLSKYRVLRSEISDTQAEIAFMPSISKYLIELMVVITALLMAALQFILTDAKEAVGVLSVFLAAGARIAPAVMRIQQNAILLKSNFPSAGPTLKLIDELHNENQIGITQIKFERNHEKFIPEIHARDLSLTFPEHSKPSIDDLSFSVMPGQVMALVGPSGSGKTTIADIISGILKPSTGEIKVSGCSPEEAIKTWPGAIAYVPQDITIVEGTVLENITLGFDASDVAEDFVWKALKIAHLDNFVKSLRSGLHSEVGESGFMLSGGQRQRLGLARALITNPKLIILDEATSALDAETEIAVTDSMRELKGESTVIVIAHRLSTVRNADSVAYIENGKLISRGSFESVRSEVKDFDKNAELSGL